MEAKAAAEMEALRRAAWEAQVDYERKQEAKRRQQREEEARRRMEVRRDSTGVRGGDMSSLEGRKARLGDETGRVGPPGCCAWERGGVATPGR